MNGKVLHIIRGLPGSGKTTLAIRLVGSFNFFEADQYFMRTGIYCFNKDEIDKAHASCQMAVRVAMRLERERIAVSNTFVKLWEMRIYFEMAKDYKYDVQVIECHGTWESVHGIPRDVINRMRQNWEHYKGVHV